VRGTSDSDAQAASISILPQYGRMTRRAAGTSAKQGSLPEVIAEDGNPPSMLRRKSSP
jgi:hypothetical protein